jgi:hypothetical protein
VHARKAIKNGSSYCWIWYPVWLCALRGRGARSGTCSVDRLSTYPRIEKSYHLKPTMIREKNVGYHNHDLKTCLLHPNLTLLDKNASYPTKVHGVRNTKTPTVRNARRPTWTDRFSPDDAQPVYNDLTAWRLNQGRFSIP